MSNLTRRTFVRRAAGLTCGAALPAIGAPVQATLAVEPRIVFATVPANFTGLSYESAQLAHPDFFSSSNTVLISFVRTLGARGVLRVGGNTSEFSIWSPNGTAGAQAGAVGPDTGAQKHARYVISREAIRNLAGFVEAANWQLIYGLNLGKGTPEQAAHEAKAVSDAAGNRLIEFQIGNEPDLFHRNGLRPPNWNFADYFSQWKQFASAVRNTVPDGRFAAPDVANNVEWIVSFAQQGKSEIVELTGHYYAEGPPENPAMNIERLLHPNPKLERNIATIQNACQESRLRYRMTETNSCYHGGKPGVSDTFASALWGGDYMLQLAQAGFVGINFHGGGEGYYTPIAGSQKSGFSARPLYYGMLLAQQFTGTRMVKCTLDTHGVNATAYAGLAGSQRRIAIFNKDSQRDLRVQIKSGANGRLWRLAAPGLDSKTGVKLAGSEVNSSGSWSPAREERLSPHHGALMVDVPAASAVVAFL